MTEETNDEKQEMIPRIQLLLAAPTDEEGDPVVDKEGKPITAGQFYFPKTEQYAKKIKFRPLKVMLSYLKYTDPTGNDFSVEGYSQYTDLQDGYYKDGILDTLGTERCGRMAPAELKDLSKDDQKAHRNQHKVFYNLFGVADFGDGKPVLAEFRGAGGRIIQLSDGIDAAINSKASINRDNAKDVFPKELLKHELEVTLVKMKDENGTVLKTPNGHVRWEYAIKSIGYDKPIKDVKKAFEELNDFLHKHNTYVQKMYEENKAA